MQVGRIAEIEGSRVLVHGQSQGFFGLPVRHSRMHDSVTGPDTPIMETAWFPTPNEIQRMINGAPVIVRIVGGPLPAPMNVYIGEEPK